MTMDNIGTATTVLNRNVTFILFIYSARGIHKEIEQINLSEMVFNLHIHILVAQPFEELRVKCVFT